MKLKEFIEKYVRIKTKKGYEKIILTDYQVNLIKHLEHIKKEQR